MRGHLGPPWRHGHWQKHRRFRENLRHYTGAHLHRRLFLWFGAAIFLTVLMVGGITGDHLADRPRRGVLFVALPALALWVLSGKIARRIARPLDELVHVSGEIGRGNLAARARLACGGFDEVATLARSINDMAGRIERQIGDQRELLAGVSHELRTPLARLQGAARHRPRPGPHRRHLGRARARAPGNGPAGGRAARLGAAGLPGPFPETARRRRRRGPRAGSGRAAR